MRLRKDRRQIGEQRAASRQYRPARIFAALLAQHAECPDHRCVDRRGEGIRPIARLLDVGRRRQRALISQHRVGEFQDAGVRAPVVFAAKIELIYVDRLTQEIQPARIDVVAIIENALLEIGQAEHIGYLGQCAHDPPLIVVGVLELIDNNHRKPIRDERAQGRTTLKQVGRPGREEIAAVESQLGGLPLALDMPVAIKGRFLQTLLGWIKEADRPPVQQATMCLQHLHAEGVIGLDRDGPAFARRQYLLAAQENLPDSRTREAEEQNLLARLQCREPVLRLRQRDRRLPRTWSAEDQQVPALCDDRLAFIAQLQLHPNSSLRSSDGGKAMSSGTALNALWMVSNIPRIVAGSSAASLRCEINIAA